MNGPRPGLVLGYGVSSPSHPCPRCLTCVPTFQSRSQVSEFIKKRILRDLIDELADVDSTTLELIGHKVIETRESPHLVHHGINKDYKAVGYTVDSFSQDGALVGEYSTQADYFDDASGAKKEHRYDKIIADVQHAMHHGGPSAPNKIYLVSSREEPPSFRQGFNQSSLAQEHRERLIFLDARELATTIFESARQRPTAVDFFRHYLPDFAQNLDNYEYYGRIPPACINHQSEPLFLAAIRKHFTSGQHICVLSGLSGSGKTQAAVEFAHASIPEFGNYLWISGDDWKNGVPLSAVKRSRGGVAINVAGVFNSTKTLLIIDNLQHLLTPTTFLELAPGFDLGGCVLVTSQLHDPCSPIHMQLPPLSLATACRILGEDEAAMSAECRGVVEACRFSPLILAVTRSVATMDGVDKEDLYREVLTDPQALQEQDGQQVMARVLNRLNKPSHAALQLLAQSGCTTYDSRFLTFFIGPNARAALQHLAILNRAGTASTLSVHDLICHAMRSAAPDGHNLAATLVRYIEHFRGEMVPTVLRQIHLSAEQLTNEHKRRGATPPDWLAYALLQIDGPAKQALIDQLKDTPASDNMPVAAIMCVVDAKEAHSYTLDEAARQQQYLANAREYEQVAAATRDPTIRAEMLHHQGKSLRRCGRIADAMACFERLLKEWPEWHATTGQIAHLGTDTQADKAIREAGEAALRRLIAEMRKDMYAVPLRVSLAAISRIRSYPALANDLKSSPIDVRRLSDIVTLAALEGFDQFYEAFVAFTSLFGYQHAETCLALAEACPGMLAILPDAVEQRQWQNACEALTNIASVAAEKGKSFLASSLFAAAIAFADELARARGDRSYEARVLTKTYLAAGKPQTALASANRIDDAKRDHWLLYQQAKAESALDDSMGALRTAERALLLASKDSKAQDRLSTYHDLVSRCLEAVDRLPEATASAQTALDLAQDDKYRAQLATRLARLKLHS